ADLDLTDLRDLMGTFNQTTQRLEQTHVQLQQQVVRLRRELEQANAQLRRSRSLAALGEMAAGIAHEVRNPLGSIQLYAQLLAEDLQERPEQAAICEKINRAITGLDAIVKDVLTFARETRLRPAAASTREMFDRALSSCEAVLDGADVRTDGLADLEVTVDAGLISALPGRRPARPGRASCRGHGAGHHGGGPTQDVQSLLHDSGDGHGPGARDRAPNHRRPRGPHQRHEPVVRWRVRGALPPADPPERRPGERDTPSIVTARSSVVSRPLTRTEVKGIP
ncbi:MAG: histidine kinase dimerization/phospho-acceptor domain-containing protein, partial [Planctomycetota bacterium]